MYLNDFNLRHLLAIFFAIGIAHEANILLGLSFPILSLIYTVGLLLIIFNFTQLKNYVWPPGLGIIGIFSLIYFIFLLIGYGEKFFRDLSSVISILVWFKCISYLSDNNSEEDQDDGWEINEENE